MPKIPELFDELRDRVAKECKGYATIVHCDQCGQICAIVFKDFTCENGDGWQGTEEEHQLDTTGATENGGIVCERCNNG